MINLASVTALEWEVLDLHQKGKSIEEIATVTERRIKTIEAVLYSVKMKLELE